MSCDALLLDLDGTLAESLGVMYGAYSDFLQHHGQAGRQEEFDELNGPPLGVVLQTLKERYHIETPADELRRTYSSLVLDRYARQVKPADGAADLLVFCERRAIRVALVTSASRRVALTFLLAHRLDRHFQALVAAEDVRIGKPDPVPYLLGLQKLEVSADRAIAVEDSPSGLRSSSGAGIRTLFLGIQDHGLAFRRVSGLREVVNTLEKECGNR